VYGNFDTAALYDFGQNDVLSAKSLRSRRTDGILASRCGMTGVDGKRVIDGGLITIITGCGSVTIATRRSPRSAVAAFLTDGY